MYPICQNKQELEELKRKVERGEAIIPGVYDPVFKAIMMTQRDYLIDIIHHITGIEIPYLKEHLRYKNPEHPIQRVGEKESRSDLIVEVKNSQIILEMNTKYYQALLDKNLSYAQKLNVSKMLKGEEYPSNQQVIEINFDLVSIPKFPKSDKIIRKFQMLEVEEHYVYTDHFVIYHVDLEKIFKKYYNERKEVDELGKELLVLMATDKEELKKLSEGNNRMEEVKKAIETLSNNQDLVTEYEKEQWDKWEQAMIKKEAIEQGRQEGIQQGIQQGIEQGIERGVKEVAKKLLTENVSIDIIVAVTGLTKKEIESIK